MESCGFDRLRRARATKDRLSNSQRLQRKNGIELELMIICVQEVSTKHDCKIDRSCKHPALRSQAMSLERWERHSSQGLGDDLRTVISGRSWVSTLPGGCLPWLEVCRDVYASLSGG